MAEENYVKQVLFLRDLTEENPQMQNIGSTGAHA